MTRLLALLALLPTMATAQQCISAEDADGILETGNYVAMTHYLTADHKVLTVYANPEGYWVADLRAEGISCYLSRGPTFAAMRDTLPPAGEAG